MVGVLNDGLKVGNAAVDEDALGLRCLLRRDVGREGAARARRHDEEVVPARAHRSASGRLGEQTAGAHALVDVAL